MGTMSLVTLLDKLRGAGLTVEPHPDWETATNGGRDRVETVGVLNHWDAISGWPGVSKYLSSNRFGGILYHGVIRADGTLHLLSQRYVWHAGSGSSQILAIAQAGGTIPDDSPGPDNQNGNPHFWSWCINYHPNDGPVPPAQYEALVVANAVAVDHFGLNVGQVARHMDWTTRKRDIDTINLGVFRNDIESWSTLKPPSWAVAATQWHIDRGIYNESTPNDVDESLEFHRQTVFRHRFYNAIKDEFGGAMQTLEVTTEEVVKSVRLLGQ